MSGKANDIIESGMLDLYVAGALSPEEHLEVEQLIASDAKVAAEVRRLQQTLEQYARTHTQTPPPALRNRVLNAVAEAANADASRTGEHSANALKMVSGGKVDQPTAKANTSTNAPTGGPRRWMLAASIAFLLGLMPGMYYYMQYQDVKSDLAQTQTQLAEARSAQSVMASKATYMQDAMDKLSDPNVTRVPMPGTAAAQKSFATVWYNRGTREVMLDMSKMPQCPDGHDYQLWAMVDGKPVDLGVFNPKNAEKAMLTMHTVGKPQMFAVTIEPQGGSLSPSLDKMVVAGPVQNS